MTLQITKIQEKQATRLPALLLTVNNMERPSLNIYFLGELER